MLTIFKKIFTWWNQDTFDTRLKTIFFGKFVGQDSFGNKYYESKNGKLKKFKDLEIKSIKCKNSEFDDNPETTAYIQVRDLTNKNKIKKLNRLI